MRTRLEVSEYEHGLSSAVRVSSGLSDVRHGLWLRLHDGEGCIGHGEIAPLDEGEVVIARESLARLSAADLGACIASLDGSSLPAIRIAECVGRLLGRDAPPSLRCGLEVALLDVLARRADVAVAELLGASPGARLEVNALLVDERADLLHEHALELLARGFVTLKLKVGRGSEDVTRARAVLDALAVPSRGAGAAISPVTVRLDANRGWSFDTAASVLDRLAGSPIDYVEEPLTDFAAPALARLRRRSVFGIALDESVCDATDLERYAAAGSCDVVVLKLQRVGGPAAVLALAEAARGHGLRVVLTDSLETAVGRAATLHCAAACTTEAVGLAGAFLMEDGSGHDQPVFSIRGPGLGVAVDS